MMLCLRTAGLVLILAALASCGGGGGGVSTTPTPPPTPVDPAPLPLAIRVPDDARVAMHVSLVSELGLGSAGTRFLWDLGDGRTSSEPNPRLAYALPGNYTITVTASSDAQPTRKGWATLRVNANPGATAPWAYRVQYQGPARGEALPEGALLRLVAGVPPAASPADGVLINASTPAAFFSARVGLLIDAPNKALLRTEDGGRSWTTLLTEPQDNGWIHDVITDGRQFAQLELRYQTPIPNSPRLATTSKFLHSFDQGRTWQEAKTFLVRVVAPDGSLWGNAVEGNEQSVAVSRDGGRTVQRFDALRGKTFTSLSFDGASRLLMWAFDNEGPLGIWVATSGDGGLTLDVRRPAAPPLADAIWHPIVALAPGALWTTASSAIDGMPLQVLYASDDLGVTWRSVMLPEALRERGPPLPWWDSFVLGPRAVVVSSVTDSWLSVDGGASWRSTTLANQPTYLLQFQADPAGIWYASYTETSIQYRSTDQGLTWQVWLAPGPNSPASDLGSTWFFDARQGFTVDFRGGLYESLDGGANWVLRQYLQPLQLADHRSDFTSSRLAFRSAVFGWLSTSEALHITRDRGQTWRVLPRPAGPAQNLDLLDSGEGYAWNLHCSGYGECAPTLHATADFGERWVERTLPAIRFWSDALLAWRGKGAGVLFNDQKLWFSTDGGIAWREARVRTPEDSPWLIGGVVVQVGFEADGTGWVLTPQELFRSNDAGAVWTRVTLSSTSGQRGFNAKLVFEGRNGAIFDASGKLLFASQDGGTTWLGP